MKTSVAGALVFVTVASAPASVGASVRQDPVLLDEFEHRFELPHGVRLMVVHVPDAPRQSTFTFLPLNLASDPPGQAQWSHLAEHMMIRSTDPHSLNPGGMTINGETSPEFLRLESIAAADHWQPSLERHVKWITARDVDPETLVREQGNIAGEAQFTIGNNATHKFAVAAWAQIAIHGADHARVNGDVRDAGTDAVETYLSDFVRPGNDVFIATIGPADPRAVEEAIRVPLARWESVGAASTASLAPQRLDAKGDATWDLPATHVMFWWVLDCESPEMRGALIGTARAMTMRLLSRPIAGNRRVRAFAHALFDVPGEAILLVNANVPADADISSVRDEIRSRVKDMGPSVQGLRAHSQMLIMQLADPDFEHMRKQTPEQWRDLTETQWLLQRSAMEYHWRQTSPDIIELARKIDDEIVETIGKAITREPTGSLTLRPHDTAPDR